MLTSEEFDDKLARHVQIQLDGALKSAKDAEKNRQTLRAIAAVLLAAKPHGALTVSSNRLMFTIRDAESFACMDQIISALALLDVPIEKWTSSEYAALRNRDYSITWGNELTMKVEVYLTQDAKCELVPDGTTVIQNYKLQCGEE